MQAGSLSDFEELVHRYEARIYRFVANSFRNPADAQEVTQEAFVTAYLQLGKFDVRRSFATWLFTIARRKCIDRHRAVRPAVEGGIPELPDLNDPSSLLAKREAGRQLGETARNALPELQFQVLWLKYAEDMSVESIARVIHRTKIHVKVLLFRARTRLAKELESRQAYERIEGRLMTNFEPRQSRKSSRARVTRLSGSTEFDGRTLNART